MSYLYKQTQLIIAFVIIVIGMSSCTTEPGSKSKLAEYGPVFENVMIADTGAFRGFSLGDQLDSIKAKESARLTEADDGYLYYEAKINDTTGTYNISYSFDEKGLNEIQSDIFINNVDHAEAVYDQFKKYFDKNYGSSESHMGFNVWTVKSEKFGKIRINLSNESADFTADKAPGKISLWVYPDKE
ncbi:MAG: hypothetical protein ACT4ON_13845 [Bacteroidota bacterium]